MCWARGGKQGFGLSAVRLMAERNRLALSTLPHVRPSRELARIKRQSRLKRDDDNHDRSQHRKYKTGILIE